VEPTAAIEKTVGTAATVVTGGSGNESEVTTGEIETEGGTVKGRVKGEEIKAVKGQGADAAAETVEGGGSVIGKETEIEGGGTGQDLVKEKENEIGSGTAVDAVAMTADKYFISRGFHVLVTNKNLSEAIQKRLLYDTKIVYCILRAALKSTRMLEGGHKCTNV